jgi:hypothetical protein
MTDQQMTSEQLVDVLADLMGLTIASEHRPGIIANLERNAELAQLLIEFPIPDEVEIAPVFQP